MAEARIIQDRAIRGGKPVVRGTTITATSLLGEWEKGLSMAEILATHPGLTEEDVRAAIEFSLRYLTQKRQAEHYVGD
ncbi:MAG TPA: DUF433 domain-containing protein [Armatimonadota bacterium]|jgi:uncharacterized protein (DUF433 family)